MQQTGVTVTASLGVISLRPDDDVRALLRRADLAMYTAKSDGRNRVVGIPDIGFPNEAQASHLAHKPPGRRDCWDFSLGDSSNRRCARPRPPKSFDRDTEAPELTERVERPSKYSTAACRAIPVPDSPDPPR